MKSSKEVSELKDRIIAAGYIAVRELIKVAEQPIILDMLTYEEVESGEEKTGSTIASPSSDKMKNAAAAKKVAIFDAFDILSRIESEKEEQKNANNKGEERETGATGEEVLSAGPEGRAKFPSRS